MQKSKKLFLAATAILGMSAVGIMAIAEGGVSHIGMTADATTFNVTFDSENGACQVVEDATKIGADGNVHDTNVMKTHLVDASTSNGAGTFAAQLEYKNAVSLAGGLATIRKGGYVRNEKAIMDMTSVTVTGTGSMTLSYGLTSACLDGSVAVTSGEAVSVSGANFFKLVASEQCAVTSIAIAYGCNPVDGGGSGVTLKASGSAYQAYRSTTSITSAVIPDFKVVDGIAYPVTSLVNYGTSTGAFESCSYLTSIAMPETITSFGSSWAWNSVTKLAEFTLPRDLTTLTSYGTLPKTALKTLNWHAKNLSYSAAVINSDYSDLVINISADVESLPSSFISTVASVKEVNYEGTRAEWTALASGNWASSDLAVNCADDVYYTLTEHFANATLGGVSDSASVTMTSGSSVKDPGKPVYEGSAKKFDGWYTAEEGGEKVTFPFTITADTDIYAHFVEWPAGTSIDDAQAVTDGTAISGFETKEGANWYYMSYTATANGAVDFQASNLSYETYNSAWGTASQYCALSYIGWKVYDDEKELVDTINYNDSVTRSAEKDVASISRMSEELLKLHVTAGETYYVAVALYSNDTYSSREVYGTGDINVTFVQDDTDYTTAVAYTYGETASGTLSDKSHISYKTFTATATGEAWFSYTSGSGSTGFTIFHFAEGSYVQDANYTVYQSTAAGAVSLTQGVTYYVAMSNSNGTFPVSYSFSFSNTVPTGATENSAYALTLGVATTIAQNGTSSAYATVSITTPGYYRIRQEGYSYSSGLSYTIYKGTIASNVTVSKTSVQSAAAGTEYYANFDAAGTYTFKLPSGSSYGDYKMTVDAIPDGYLETNAKTLSFTEETTSFTLNYGRKTSFYEITAPKDGYVTFTLGSSTSYQIKVKGASTWKYSSSTKIAEYELTAGTTYVIQLSANANSYGQAVELGVEWLSTYIVTFDSNGGSDVASESVLSGGVATQPANPSKADSIFTGWYTDEECTVAYDFSTVLTGSITLHAGWKSGKTATIESDGSLSGSAASYASIDMTSTAQNSSFSMSNHNDFGVEDVSGTNWFVSGNKGVNSSYSTLAITAEKACKLTFDYYASGESNCDYLYLMVNGTLESSLGSSGKIGSVAGVSGTFTVELSAGDVVTATFRKDSSASSGDDIARIGNFSVEDIETVDLTYHYNNGDADKTVGVIPGHSVSPANPVREGYTFSGWYTDSAFTTAYDGGAINTATDLYAKWVQNVSLTFNLNYDGAADPHVDSVAPGAAVNSLVSAQAPTRDGYSFGGWYTDSACEGDRFYGYDGISEDTVLYAKWVALQEPTGVSFDLTNNAPAAFVGGATSYKTGYSFTEKYDDNGNAVFHSGNYNKSSSYSAITFVATKAGTFSCNITCNGEGSSYDYGYILVDDAIVESPSGISNSYGSGKFVSVSNATFTQTVSVGTKITFCYVKDGSGNTGIDELYVSNVTVIEA